MEEGEVVVLDEGQRLEVVWLALGWVKVQRGFACEEVLGPDGLVSEGGQCPTLLDEKKRRGRREVVL